MAVYNSRGEIISLELDATLSEEGKAADAAAVGSVLFNGSQFVTVANSPAFVGSPVTIFQNDDASATPGIDDGLLNCVSVIKISDAMYYMYYEGFGADGGTGYGNIALCFAYSTDGATFTKGFPDGVTAPIAGTNQLLPDGAIHGQCVVRVQDANYPFRMVGIDAVNSRRIAKIWKSADGINWTLIRQITDGYNDSFVSVIVRGNLLKIFLRNRQNEIRTIGIITTDLDGNRLDSTYTTEINLNDANNQPYQASASAIDDRKELLLPTLYNPSTSAETVGAFILDGGLLQQKEINASAVITSGVKSIYFASGLVNIGLKTYAFYTTRSSDHDHFSMGSTKSAIRRIEVSVAMA